MIYYKILSLNIIKFCNRGRKKIFGGPQFGHVGIIVSVIPIC